MQPQELGSRLPVSHSLHGSRHILVPRLGGTLQSQRYVWMKLKLYKELFFLRLIKLVDVWEEIIVATQPDMYVGRRKSVLSVCKLDSSLCGKKNHN
jgi:hypothetical protein